MSDRKGDFFGGGPKGKKSFPMNDKKHDRLAISGATRSYDAGNISKGKEDAIKAAARRKLGDSVKKEPRGKRPSESLHARGHFESHRKDAERAELSHEQFHALDHGKGSGVHSDHMYGRGDEE